MAEMPNEEVISEATRKLVLSADDRHHYQQFEKLLDLVRDRTEAVARHHHNGVLIVGPSGVAKTHTVEQTLNGLKTPWEPWNARMTAMGLFNVLRENPEGVVVIDDLSSLFNASNKSALQIFLAALGGSPGEPRRVCHATANDRMSFNYTGGIVATGNKLPKRDPVVDALVSRIRVLEVEPSDKMVVAFLRSQALKGYKDVAPAAALEVVEFIINVSRASKYRLDLRQLYLGLEDYRLWKSVSRCHWQTLIQSSLERLHQQDHAKPVTRAEKKALGEQIALELFRRFPPGKNRAEREAQWKAMTDGKSYDTLQRHKRTLEAKGLLGTPVA